MHLSIVAGVPLKKYILPDLKIGKSSHEECGKSKEKMKKEPVQSFARLTIRNDCEMMIFSFSSSVETMLNSAEFSVTLVTVAVSMTGRKVLS